MTPPPWRQWASLSVHALAIFVVGFASTVLIVIDAVRAVGASPAQQASAVGAICIAIAVSSLALGLRHRQPIIVAWSTPGAALLASSGGGTNFAEATAAFLFAGALMVATALAKPLANLINRLPGSIAGAMLAGVLLHYVMAVPLAAVDAPAMVLPLAAVFFFLRHAAPLYATPVIVALALLVAAGTGTGTAGTLTTISFTQFEFVWPDFTVAALISVGVPLYLVTMASQNLPGFAVLKSNGYEPPVQDSLLVTGSASMVSSFFGAHAVNLAAITAAMAAGPDIHDDPRQRWKVILPYAAIYLCAGLAAATFVALLSLLPASLVTAVAGLALFAPFLGGISAMVKDSGDLEGAAVTFLVTGSGVSLLGIGGAFWGLLAGTIVWSLKTVWRRP